MNCQRMRRSYLVCRCNNTGSVAHKVVAPRRRKAHAQAPTPAEVRELLDQVKAKLAIESHVDWYAKLSKKDVTTSERGTVALALCDGLLASLLKTGYDGEYPWVDWQFAKQSVPKSFWQERPNQQAFFRWYAAKTGITQPEGWYNVRLRDLEQCGGRSLLFSYYKGSVNNFVRAMMPEHNWLEWRFVKVSKRFWLSKEHQRQFLSWAARELKLTSVDDWRFVSVFQMRAVGGTQLLRQYSNSMHRTLIANFPRHDWGMEWAKAVAVGAATTSDYKRVIDSASTRLGITKKEDWYNVRKGDLDKLGLPKSWPKLIDLLGAAYPGHRWLPWKFEVSPSGFWKDQSNRKEFMDWVALQLGVNGPSDWKRVTYDQVVQFGGMQCLAYHEHSVTKCVKSLYPQNGLD